MVLCLKGIFICSKLSTPSSGFTADNNPDHYTYAGNDTFDKVFLLSITEANKYFADNEDRCCDYTKYGEAQRKAKDYDSDIVVCNWWLRSPGESQYKATLVRPAGDIPDFGYSVNETYSGVRPALWIDFTS